MAWHDAACQGLDLQWDDERPGCRKCKRWAPRLLPAQALPPPPPPPDTKRQDLICIWPPGLAIRTGTHHTDILMPPTAQQQALADDHETEKVFQLVQNLFESLEKNRTTSADKERESLGEPHQSAMVVEYHAAKRSQAGTIPAIFPHMSLGSTPASRLYHDLQDTDAIPLLILHGSKSQQEPIHCTLETWRLQDPCIPIFEAVSYCWSDSSGNNSLCRNIFIDTHYDTRPVTRNCEAALRSFRTQSDRLIWVDSICIDQNNQEERATQVALMPRIYSTAARVLMYLGDGDPETDEVMDALVASGSQPKNGLDVPHVKLRKILDRKYFTRTWMVQEVQLANSASLRIGSRTIQLEKFWSHITSRKVRANDPQRKIWVEHGYLGRDSKPGSSNKLLTYLHAIRHCQSGDPRDQVYALLGLARSEAVDLPVDYGISVQQLYTGLAMYWLAKGDFTFLNSLGHPKSVPNLPSWVPDWTSISTWPKPEVQLSCEAFQLNTPVLSKAASGLDWYVSMPDVYAWTMDQKFWSSFSREHPDHYAFGHPTLRPRPRIGEISNAEMEYFRASQKMGYILLDAFRLPFNRTLRSHSVMVRDNLIYLENITGSSSIDSDSNGIDAYKLQPYVCLHLRKALLLRRYADTIFSVEGHFRINCKPPDIPRTPKLKKFNACDFHSYLAVLEMTVVNQWLMDVFYFGTRLQDVDKSPSLSSRHFQCFAWFPQAVETCTTCPAYLYQSQAALQYCNDAQFEAMIALRNLVIKIISDDELGKLQSYAPRGFFFEPDFSLSWPLFNKFLKRNDNLNLNEDIHIDQFDQDLVDHIESTCAKTLKAGPKTIDEAISLWSQKMIHFEESRKKCGSMRAALQEVRDSWASPRFEFVFSSMRPSSLPTRKALHAFYALIYDPKPREMSYTSSTYYSDTATLTADHIFHRAWLLLRDLEPSPQFTAEQNCNILWIHIITMDMIVQLGEILHHRRLVKRLDDAAKNIERIVLI